MCLKVSSTAKCLIANEDIICWKVLREIDKSAEKYKYQTPYQDAHVTIGQTYHATLLKEVTEINIGLHSFKFANDAMREREVWIEYEPLLISYVIAKCVIPKGSQYYEGKFKNYAGETEVDSYASNELKYLEIIE